MIVSLFIVFLTLLFVYWHWYRKVFKMAQLIDQIPGPPKLPFIGNAHQFQKTGHDFFLGFCERADLYRSHKMFRFWIGPVPNVVFLSADVIEPLLISTSQLTKSHGYDFVLDWLHTGLLTSTDEKWHSRRKILTPAFHFQILNDFIHTYWEHSQILIKHLKQFHQKTINVYPLMTLCTLDIICESAMGVKVNAQTHSDSEYVRALHIVGQLIISRAVQPWMWPDFIYYNTFTGRKFKNNLKILHDFTRKVIVERAEEMKKVTAESSIKKPQRLAFLDLLLHMSDNGKVLSFEDIQEEVDTIMFEGHDTTASAASWALYCIGSHPDIQEKLREELDRIFGGSDREVTAEDLREMKYLEIVLKETLRMFPSAPNIGRKLTNDLEVCGKTIPKGTSIIIDIYNLHRDPSVFPSPEVFDPDRFSQENSVKRNPFAYIPFSAGSRNCIGQKFAMLEEKVIISSILRKFHIEATQSRQEVKPVLLLVLSVENGIYIKFTLR